MTPVRQTVFGGVRGNCLQAAVASLLDLELDNVPNFMEIDGPAWFDNFVEFMLGKGLYPIYLEPDMLDGDGRALRGLHLIQGDSPHGDYDHVVVARNGELVHDPHPDNDGVLNHKWYILFAATLERQGGMVDVKRKVGAE